MRTPLLALTLLLAPAAAFAQAPAAAGSGLLVVERLENSFVFAPDFKVTAIDGDTGQLAGGYAGWLAEDTLFVGGAAYWLADGPDDAELTYGGVLIGWNTPAEHRIQFGARGLVGIGRAQLGTDIMQVARFGSRTRRGRSTEEDSSPTETVRVRSRDDFFVFEPQLTLVTKLTNCLGVTWGAGYRLTGYTDFLDDRLRGVTGSVALQLGGW